jgi:hypothetical protein
MYYKLFLYKKNCLKSVIPDIKMYFTVLPFKLTGLLQYGNHKVQIILFVFSNVCAKDKFT